MTKESIRHISSVVVDRLKSQQLFDVTGSKGKLVDALEKTITDELSAEDRLNAEVRQMLKQFDAEFDSGRADYQKMFLMVKNKLVKERSLVL